MTTKIAYLVASLTASTILTLLLRWRWNHEMVRVYDAPHMQDWVAVVIGIVVFCYLEWVLDNNDKQARKSDNNHADP